LLFVCLADCSTGITVCIIAAANNHTQSAVALLFCYQFPLLLYLTLSFLCTCSVRLHSEGISQCPMGV